MKKERVCHLTVLQKIKLQLQLKKYTTIEKKNLKKNIHLIF